MTGWHFALLERLHGHVAILGLAVLLHPVITLRTRKRLGRWTVLTADLGALLLVAPFVLGLVIYPGYRQFVKPDLLRDQPAVGLAFESKEHLAVFAVALAIGGALSLRTAGRTPAGRNAAWSLLLASWLCGVATALLGWWVAASAHVPF